MKVLFLKPVEGTAAAGDVKEVSPGYARNFLVPKHLAVVADEHIIAQVQQKQRAAQLRLEKALEEAREIEARLKRMTLTVHARSGEGGRLFGTVTAAEIAQQLKREAGIVIDKRKIEVQPAIKSLGPHEVKVTLHPDVVATLRLVVAAE